MKKRYSYFSFLSMAMLFIFCADGNTQITILADAEQGAISLAASESGTDNRSSLAYNPLKSVYYSVNAGSGNYYVDTYDADGNLLDSVVSGFDYRGAWWNPLLFTFEGNGYNSAGIFSRNIDPFTGVAIAGGSVVAANTQPNSQSIGDLDTARYELVYYHDGNLYRYSRLDDLALGTTLITGLPSGTTLNANSVFYTGFPGMDYGVFDYANLRFVFLNILGEYVGHSQLPGSAFAATSFKTSWANRLFWIFDSDVDTWFSYKVHDGAFVGVEEKGFDASGSIRVYPNPLTSETQLDFGDLNAEVSQIRIMDISGKVVKEYTNLTSTRILLNLQDEAEGVYILQLTTLEGGLYNRKLIKQ